MPFLRIKNTYQENPSGNRFSISAMQCGREHLPALSLQKTERRGRGTLHLSLGRQDRVREITRSIGVQNNVDTFHKFPRRFWK